jgi:ABC-type sugar transport system substrate-binding protein
MSRSTRITMAAAVALASILGGCKKKSGKAVVAFVQVGAESSWRTDETKSIQDEAAKRNYDLRFADCQGKQANQIKALRSFINQGVDVIVLAPIVETGWDEILTKAKQAGIPVILVDRGVEVTDESLYVTKIASDFVVEGRTAGEWLAKKLSGEGSVAELRGTEGAAPANDRKKGFEEVLAKYPKMKIVLTETAKFEREAGKKVMKTFLESGKKIDAVYAHNDDMALGAIQAIEEAGRKPGEDILVVSIDGVRAAFEAMIEGKLNCTVECNPLLGPMAFDAVEAVLAGETLPKHTVVNDRVFDQSTAAAELPNRKY